MLGRTIQLDVVKKTKKDETTDPVSDEDFQDRMALAGAIAVSTMRSVTEMVAVYMVADTIRKIAVNRLSK